MQPPFRCPVQQRSRTNRVTIRPMGHPVPARRDRKPEIDRNEPEQAGHPEPPRAASQRCSQRCQLEPSVSAVSQHSSRLAAPILVDRSLKR